MNKITKIAALIMANDSKMLLVRKVDSEYFILPGGRPERGEDHTQTLVREIREELDCVLDKASLSYLGSFSDVAANEENTVVEIQLYKGSIQGHATPSSEIEEAVWVSTNDASKLKLAPSIKNRILPFLVERGLV